MKASISAPDLASLLGVTERTLRRWEEDGSGPKRIVENLEPVYLLESLVPWLKKHRPDIDLGTAAHVASPRGRRTLLDRWEEGLCLRYKLKSTEILYEALRHADFHETGVNRVPDQAEHWNMEAYAAFSGTIVRHKLRPQQLQDLLVDFRARNDLGLAAKKHLSAAEFREQIDEALTDDANAALRSRSPALRQTRDYVALAHRYACAVVREYHPPGRNPHIMADLAELDKS